MLTWFILSHGILCNLDFQYDNPVSSVSGNLVSTSASVSSPVLGLATTVSKSNNSTGI